MSLRRKLLDAMLRKESLVAVPESWQKEYVKLAGDKIRNSQAIDKIVREYNLLLKDYYNKHTIKELKAILKEDGISVASDLSKEELVEKVVSEYQMVFNKKDNK